MLGIVFTAVDIEKFKVVAVICHLINDWGVLFCYKPLVNNIGNTGMTIGGVMYSIGAVLYGIGAKKIIYILYFISFVFLAMHFIF